MRQQLRSVTKRLGAVLGKLTQRRMEEEIQEHGRTGREPQTETGTAFIAMTDAFGRMANASIGGKDYDEAVEEYEDAQRAFNEARARSRV